MTERIETLKNKLNYGSHNEKISALLSIDQFSASPLFESIVVLTNHYAADVRVAALQALRFIDQCYLTNVIREGLRDENKDVRRAASELFHLHDLAA